MVTIISSSSAEREKPSKNNFWAGKQKWLAAAWSRYGSLSRFVIGAAA